MKVTVVTAEVESGKKFGAAPLKELSVNGIDEYCNHLILDTAATNTTNTNARRFYKREGLVDAVIGFVKPLRSFA